VSGPDRGGGGAELNAAVAAEFRATGGQVGGPLAGTRLLLLHHVGARSGTARVVPLAYVRLTDGRLVVTASDGGSPRHPGWYYNLKANPEITVELGDETFVAVAEELDRARRAELWPAIVERAPAVGGFQTMTARTIPVFILTREGSASGR
jgi:deazaflavin-dependent oxidoreductase (nitroreductase family)